MRIIVQNDRPARPDPIVRGSSLPDRVPLSPNALHVKAGTPLCAGLTGWEVAYPGRPVVLFATNAGRGGELVNVAREVSINLNQEILVPCARYGVKDIDETGYVVFEPQVDGPYYALTRDTILLVPDR
jgi:hypothetical protein